MVLARWIPKAGSKVETQRKTMSRRSVPRLESGLSSAQLRAVVRGRPSARPSVEASALVVFSASVEKKFDSLAGSGSRFALQLTRAFNEKTTRRKRLA